jgi:hypothetical protein
MAYHDREKKMYGGGMGRKKSMRGGYAMAGEVMRKPMMGGGERMPKGHGGESKKSGDYSSISDMEKDCNRRVGYNESLKSKEDK